MILKNQKGKVVGEIFEGVLHKKINDPNQLYHSFGDTSCIDAWNWEAYQGVIDRIEIFIEYSGVYMEISKDDFNKHKLSVEHHNFEKQYGAYRKYWTVIAPPVPAVPIAVQKQAGLF